MVRNSREDWKIYKNVFDAFTERVIFKMITQGHIDGLYSPFMVGKESNIFIARKGTGYRIVKIYRLESCNFKQMYSYIRMDPRYTKIKKSKRSIVFAWVQREFRNLLLAREKINVPTPIQVADNVLVMEQIGDLEPAPQLKDARPDSIDFFNTIIASVKKLYYLGLVHADLSEFNILNLDGVPYFIDFSQSTSTKSNETRMLLKRDIANIVRFAKKCRFSIDPEETYDYIVNL